MKRFAFTTLALAMINVAVAATPAQKPDYSGIFAGIYGGVSSSNYKFKIQGSSFTAGNTSGSSNPIVGARIGLLSPLVSPMIRVGGEVFTDYTSNTNKFTVKTGSAYNTTAKNGYTAGADGIFGLSFNKIGLLYAKLGATISRLNYTFGSNSSGAGTSFSGTGYQNGFLYGFGIERMLRPNLSLNLGYQHIQTSQLSETQVLDSAQTKETLKLTRSDILISVNYYF